MGKVKRKGEDGFNVMRGEKDEEGEGEGKREDRDDGMANEMKKGEEIKSEGELER
jgi:hypothetical protein